MIQRLRAQHGTPLYGDLARVAELTPAQVTGLNDLAGCAGLTHEHDLLLLCPVLTLLSAAPGRAHRPLHAGVLSPGDLQAITVTYRDLTPSQRGLLPSVLSAAETPLHPGDAQSFVARAFCSRAAPERNSMGYWHTQLLVQWGIDPPASDRPPISGTAMIQLPMSLPDDRRDRTRIEIAQ